MRLCACIQCTRGCRDTPTHGPRFFFKKGKKEMSVRARAKWHGFNFFFLVIESRTYVSRLHDTRAVTVKFL